MTSLDVLIPTYRRPAALAVTLTSLIAQTLADFRIVISDQTEDSDASQCGEALAAIRVLRAHNHRVDIHKHLPRKGMAEQRQFLLDRATAAYVLFLDDDLILEHDVFSRMLAAIREEQCGFVGSAVIGLSFLEDERQHEQGIEFWNERVAPERILPNTPQWQRYCLHNAANLYHLQRRLGITAEQQRKYRVAWVGGCVLYDTERLRSCGGFNFWRELPPEHAGEDVLAQLRVMARYGGCGLLPSGVYHQELPTTLKNRPIDAPKIFATDPAALLGSA